MAIFSVKAVLGQACHVATPKGFEIQIIPYNIHHFITLISRCKTLYVSKTKKFESKKCNHVKRDNGERSV